MPSRTFLADTSCLRAAFLFAYTHFALDKNNTQKLDTEYTSEQHVCKHLDTSVLKNK